MIFIFMGSVTFGVAMAMTMHWITNGINDMRAKILYICLWANFIISVSAFMDIHLLTRFAERVACEIQYANRTNR